MMVEAVKYRISLVTPFTGVWIEITQAMYLCLDSHVTPFTGVWIEITTGR